MCLGNSCRSQMAEGFARIYGKDVLEVKSAGLAPASSISGMTRQVMREKNISLDGHYPKSLEDTGVSSFDLIVNISGYDFPILTKVPIRVWQVEDPIGTDEKTYREVRDQLEHLVMALILELRRHDHKRKRPVPV